MNNEVENKIRETARPVIDWLLTNGLDYAFDILSALLILIIGVIAIKLMTKALNAAINRRGCGREMLARFLVSIAVKVAWAFLIIIVLGRLGVEVGPLVAGLGVTGFVLGFAFQESLGSLAAGVMIAFTQPFKIGDHVIVAGQEGVVNQLDMMAVVVTTADNRRITIPNKQAWGGVITKFN